jgi:serine/threonine protein kinase/WD40 repeat protein
MIDSSSALGPDDDVVIRFLAEHDQAADRDVVLEKYCAENADNPTLVAILRDLAAAFRGLEGARPEAAGSQPQRLGEYKIIRLISRGGMGEIYEAFHERLLRRVAIKTIRRDRPLGEARARFRREQLVLARLHQTHVIPIYAAGVEGDWQYLVMPYIEGATLHRLIGAAAGASGSVPALTDLVHDAAGTPPTTLPAATPATLSSAWFRSAARVVAEAADAVQHVHDQGFIHRDLKPSNVMVDLQGHSWVIDFGLAGYLKKPKAPGQAEDLATDPVARTPFVGEPGTEVRTGSHGMGTPPFMAPEQVMGKADARTDVWGLGVVLHELLTLGRLAVSRPAGQDVGTLPPLVFAKSVPADLAAICRKALAADADRRYATPRALADDLRCWLANRPTTARPAGVVRRVSMWARRKPGPAAAVAFGAVALLLGIGLLLYAAQNRAWQAQEATRAAEQADIERRAETLRHEVLTLRPPPHRMNWSRQTEERLRALAQLRPGSAVRDLWATSLLGLDAFETGHWAGVGGGLVAFDASGTRLVTGGRDAEGEFPACPAAVVDRAAGRVIQVSERPVGGPVVFDPAGTPVQLVADPTDHYTLLLWDVLGQRPVRKLARASGVGAQHPTQSVLALSADTAIVAAAFSWPDKAGILVIWDAKTGNLINQSPWAATALALAPDGSLLAAGDADGRLRVWKLPGSAEPERLQSDHVRINCLAFARDKRLRPGGPGWLLAAGSAGGSVTLWDLAARLPRTYFRGAHYEVSAVALSPDATLLASGSHGEVHLWDAAAGQQLLSLPAHQASGLAFSADGRRLAASREPTVPGGAWELIVWDLEPGRGTWELRGLNGQIARVSFSQDGRWLAALAHNWQIGVWDLQTGLLRAVVEVPPGFLADNACLALRADGRLLAYSGGSWAVVWDLESEAQLRAVKLPPGLVEQVIFDPTGKRLLLCRVETQDGVPPFTENSWEHHPRLCRVRNLLGTQPCRPLVERDDFPRRVFNTMPICGGRLFAVLGMLDAEGHQRLIAFDSLTGKLRWWLPAGAGNHSANLVPDPAGDCLAAWPLGEGKAAGLLDAATGQRLHTFSDAPTMVSPGALYVGRRIEYTRGGMARMSRRGNEADCITFATLARIPCVDCRFHPDGRRMAWGLDDGTVIVSDLDEVRRRLADAGLDW